MTISIEAIKFNHDPLSADTDALTIRKNQLEDVSVPEWKSGMSLSQASPAAYTIEQIRNNRLTIQVQFKRANSDPTTIEVRAVPNGANLLGSVVSRRINFTNNVSAFETFQLNTSSLNPGVGIWDIAWDWSADGVFLQTTRHLIYTLVSAPQPPWGQPGSTFPGFQLPWTEVLNYACRQAGDAKTVDQAADKLTRWIYFSLGGSKLQYNQGSGDSSFTIPGMQTFKCTQFLQLLTSDPGTRSRINCTDCATILSSFANILGCNLEQSKIGYEFETNLIQKIGLPTPNRQYFNFHEVAWKFPANGNGNGNGSADAFVYDPCLEFDGDTNRSDTHFQPTLGIKKPLGVPGREGYHFRLIAPFTGSDQVQARLDTRVTRLIDGSTTTRTPVDPDQQRRLAERYDFSSWRVPEPAQPCGCYDPAVVTSQSSATKKRPYPNQKPPDSEQQPLPPDTFDPKRFSPSGWELRELEKIDAEKDRMRLTDAIWVSTGCFPAELRLVTYECASVAAARLFVLSLLGEFEVPGIKRRYNFIIDKKKVEVGDVAFADVDELVMLFSRGRTVLLIQNAGKTVVPVSEFAHEIDKEIPSNQKLEKAHEEEESVMPDVLGSWSLRRLAGSGPADLSIDGFLQLDENTDGVIRGCYADLRTQTVVPVTGSITDVTANSYRLELEHSAGGGVTRQYSGQLIERQEGDPGLQLVVGRFRQNYPEIEAAASSTRSNGSTSSTSSASSAGSTNSAVAFDGQEGGIWVATKP